MKHQLLNRIHSKEAVIGVVGMGYVGLPLILRFIESGFSTFGFDVDETKIKKIEQGESYIRHIPHEKIAQSLATKRLKVTSDWANAKNCDALIVCVPTPLNTHHEPDLSYVVETVKSLTPYMKPGQLFSLESTTYPGTTEEEFRPRIESRGLKIGKDAFLVFSPEREDPGNRQFRTQIVPKVVGGSTKTCLELGMALYGKIIDKIVPVSSTRAAEMTKLLENIYRAVNIGLVNELKTVADRMNIDIWEVIDAAATKPFGFTPFYPGPGLGGHCIPIDPFYLTWKAREYGIHTRFIELAGEVNTAMPNWVVSKIASALNDQNKPVRNSKILILGLAYKKNIDDIRESPSIEMMELLRAQGAKLSYSDPYVPHFPRLKEHSFELSSMSFSSDNLKEFDCVVIATDHDDFDYESIQKHSALVIDTRGRYRNAHQNVVHC